MAMPSKISNLSPQLYWHNWLVHHPEVKVAVSQGWGLAEFLDEDNLFRGVCVDYLKLGPKAVIL